MDKKLSLTIIILTVIEIICSFTPFCLDEKYWKYQESFVYHGFSTLERHKDISIWGNNAVLGKILAVLFICAAIAVIIVYLLKTVNNMPNITKKAWLFSVVHTALMIIFLFYSCAIASVESISYRYTYGINWMSYIIIALNLISLILAFILKSGKVQIKQETATSQKETANDLFEYKELLDSGVITKEEFEEKKKQILGI